MQQHKPPAARPQRLPPKRHGPIQADHRPVEEGSLPWRAPACPDIAVTRLESPGTVGQTIPATAAPEATPSSACFVLVRSSHPSPSSAGGDRKAAKVGDAADLVRVRAARLGAPLGGTGEQLGSSVY
jgi:hypothetical protein